ncbi:hypothetical protein LB545_29945 [Mesorhizobium sp. BR1-1-6]|uniref:hypothetical protein n=1 Tax=Mesorhizobium sp. BR1-1-6 TaxID=2876648 RepID=UPI001CD05770|nr:hypothetical protein [Mesorhizobium sp. BR1-1-6]MBZ9898537.1 hypothetical protein [Mesorhizobium sp. BR1-1-6]
MPPPVDIESPSHADLKVLVVDLMGRVADLSQMVIEQREEIARLKGLKGRPDLKPGKPSGMEKASRPARPSTAPRRGGARRASG